MQVELYERQMGQKAALIQRNEDSEDDDEEIDQNPEISTQDRKSTILPSYSTKASLTESLQPESVYVIEVGNSMVLIYSLLISLKIKFIHLSSMQMSTQLKANCAENLRSMYYEQELHPQINLRVIPNFHLRLIIMTPLHLIKSEKKGRMNNRIKLLDKKLSETVSNNRNLRMIQQSFVQKFNLLIWKILISVLLYHG